MVPELDPGFLWDLKKLIKYSLCQLSKSFLPSGLITRIKLPLLKMGKQCFNWGSRVAVWGRENARDLQLLQNLLSLIRSMVSSPVEQYVGVCLPVWCFQSDSLVQPVEEAPYHIGVSICMGQGEVHIPKRIQCYYQCQSMAKALFRY